MYTFPSFPGPCYQFKDTGSCRYGNACRFSHDGGASSGGAPPPRSYDDRDRERDYPPRETRFGVNERYGSLPPPQPHSAEAPPTAWHPTESNNPPAARTDEPRYDDQPRYEDRSDRYERDDRTRYEDRPRYDERPAYEERPQREERPAYGNANAYGYAAPSAYGAPPAAPSYGGYSSAPRRDDTCYSFARDGQCRYGAQCRFSHQPGGSAPPPPRSSPPGGYFGGSDRPRGGGGPCYQFKDTGSCRYGDQCRFTHGGPSASTVNGDREPYSYDRDGRDSRSFSSDGQPASSYATREETNEQEDRERDRR